jgi:hypothetical protein
MNAICHSPETVINSRFQRVCKQKAPIYQQSCNFFLCKLAKDEK